MFPDLDLVIGAPVELEHRIARLASTPKFSAAREVMEYPSLLKMFWNDLLAPMNLGNRMMHNVQRNIAWMGSVSFQCILQCLVLVCHKQIDGDTDARARMHL